MCTLISCGKSGLNSRLDPQHCTFVLQPARREHQQQKPSQICTTLAPSTAASASIFISCVYTSNSRGVLKYERPSSHTHNKKPPSRLCVCTDGKHGLDRVYVCFCGGRRRRNHLAARRYQTLWRPTMSLERADFEAAAARERGESSV